MIQRVDKNNPLVKLMKKYQKGTRSAFQMGPFLPLVRIKERGLSFNDVMRDATAMTEAALMSFEFGFESTVLPFDLNVEAEMLGAQVRYHDGFDGNPVYPTIATKPFTPEDDIKILNVLPEKGRIPAILKSIGAVKEQAEAIGAVGVFIPGPFTLAGQVMDMDGLYKMVLKQPEKALDLFEQLSTFIKKTIDLYIDAGADFMIVVEGAGSSIAPQTFRKLLLPSLKDILKSKNLPHIVSFFGKSMDIIECILECDTDGIMLYNEYDIEKARERIPGSIPLFGECGSLDILANSTPAEIAEKVRCCLDLGFTTVCPPADIYPPARVENIEAFLKALQE